MNKKIGRNDSCPCGSGKKYKKCCYNKSNSMTIDIKLQQERLKAKQIQIEKQQGLGRSIISIEHNGYRFVAVGPRMYYSEKWKTFHDFLLEYIRIIFGKEWGQKEFSKPFEERHPVVQWYETSHKYMRNQHRTAGINNAPMIGALSVYINLSYNLYLLAHNVEIQERLIRRLKDISQFRGAYYETCVAAEFIKAGFELEIENEEDSKTTHCEFTATAKTTGQKYSTEAKARQPYKNHSSIGNQLYKALKKEAKHNRVIFIDVNIKDFMNEVPAIIDELKSKEDTLKIEGLTASPAYVFITNHPYDYELERVGERRAGFAHGYKIPEFSFDFKFTNIRDALKARDKHKDMFDLVKSMCEHEEIPSTFDGEYPEFSFSDKDVPQRLIIGNTYAIPGPEGKDIPGVLTNAIVLEKEKKVMGCYQIKGGKQVMCSNPMTEEELIAYRRHPDTFFGVPLNQNKEAKDPLEFFDFLYEAYKNCPRDKLLDHLKNHPNFEQLKTQDNNELVITYCESVVYSAVNSSNKKRNK